MMFDYQNHVAPDPNGGFRSVVGGEVRRFPGKEEAERDYNTRRGLPNQPLPTAPPAGGVPGMGTGSSYSEGLQRQIEAERKMLDAIATGNREKFEEAKREFNEAMRLRWSEFGGYERGQEVPGQGAGKRIREIYDEMRQKRGVPSMGPDDAELNRQVAIELGLRPEQVRSILSAGKDYFIATHGQRVPDEVIDKMVGDLQPFGRRPGLDARKFIETQEEFRQKLAEEQRQFQGKQYSDMARSLLSAATSLRGPRDYARYQQLLGGGRDVLSQLQGDQPLPAFGFGGEPEPARVTDILDALGIRPGNFGPAGLGGGTVVGRPVRMGPFIDEQKPIVGEEVPEDVKATWRQY